MSNAKIEREEHALAVNERNEKAKNARPAEEFRRVYVGLLTLALASGVFVLAVTAIVAAWWLLAFVAFRFWTFLGGLL